MKPANTPKELEAQRAFAEAATRLFQIARGLLGSASPSHVGHLVAQAREELDTIDRARMHLPED